MPRQGSAGALLCQHAVEAHYEWKVENFFSLSAEAEHYFYDSPDIQFAGSTFQLWLYPKIALSSLPDCLMVALVLIKQSTPINIRYTLGIKTAAGDTEVRVVGTREFPPYNDDRDCYINIAKLLERRQDLAPCDDLTITVSLEMIDVSRPDKGTREVGAHTSVEDAGGQEANGGLQALENTDFVRMARSLKHRYAAGKDCDVTLEVKNKTFRAHKLILGAHTPVLAAMFAHDTTEAETGIDPEAFEVFLRFMYSCTAKNVTGENVANVYYAADKYDLPDLKKECVRHMLSNLTTGTVCSVIALAESHGDELLQQKATEFFVENAREIFRSSFWRKFMVENSSLAYELINRVHEN